MVAWGALFGAASFGLNFLGQRSARSDAKNARAEELAFLKKKYEEYDLPLYGMTEDRMRADRDHLIDTINLKRENEIEAAAFTDKNNLRAWGQSLKIRDFQIRQNKRLFDKSEELFGAALSLNQESAALAKQQTMLAQRETEQSYAFQNEEQIISSIMKKGELDAKGQAGRSAAKQGQSLLAEVGRNQAIMTESLVSANRSTRMQLMDISRQHRAADTKAYANRMLKPEDPPMPLKPLKTPVSKYMLPREFIDADFGPEPIMGIPTTQVPSSMSVLASAASSGLSMFANNYQGTNRFDYGGTTTNHTDKFGSFTEWTYDPN